MRKSLIALFIILLIAVSYYVTNGNTIVYQDIGSQTEISPFSNEFTMITKLYFLAGDSLVSETRAINIELLESEMAVMTALKSGSKVSDFSTPLGDDVNIISIETVNRTCYVNLSNGFLTSNTDLLNLKVMAIVNSLVEFESIDFVQILVDGMKLESDLDKLGDPLSKNTSLVQEEELQHKDVVKKFLENITQGRYDLAFDLIDSNSKKVATFREFKEAAAQLRQDTSGYALSYVFAKREQGRYIIQAKYTLRDIPSNTDLIIKDQPENRDYSWPMTQEDGLWKINFFEP